MFSNLHVHTDYSLHDGFAKIPELVSKAKKLGYPALAITDHGTVTGLIDFYEECKKQGIKPILGCEFYYTNEITINDTPTYHLLILAKNNTGYKNLMKLDTYAHKHFYRKPRIGIEALREYHEGLICTTACVAGPLSAGDPLTVYNDLLEVFGSEDLYVEIQPHDFPEQIEYNQKWADYFSEVKTIITLDSHYINKEDIQAHKLWLGLGDDSQYYASDDYYLRSEGEIIDWFNQYGIDTRPYIENVQEIVDKCNVEIEFGGEHYPVFCDDPETYVRDKCNEGYKNMGIASYPNKAVYIKQVKHELDVLNQLGYMNYFCIIDDMLRWCRENNIPTGLGRGSVVGSTVAWLMGITQIDPIKYNLVFERFANPERVTPADVDTDVSTPRRNEVINYIQQRYGEVYQIRTTSYIKEKSAVQRAGQALGVEPAVINKVSKNLVNVEDMPSTTNKEKEWKALAMKFRGHIISYGKHASAVLVAPEDVCNWTAVEKQGDDMVVCHDFHQLEAQGLLKLDILGLETLDVLEQTKHRIGKNIDISRIPTDDKATAEMLRRCDTKGCFQIESQVMTNIIRRMNVKTVEDMVAVVALGRPGPLDSGMVEHFLKRRNHQEKVMYDDPKLEPILKDTEGIIVYQEQIMQIAQALCGYTLGQADNLRRIVGRKKVDEMQPVIDDMIEKGVQNGHPREVMKKITDNIVTFASYGFNRGHSAAYGMTAWATAWFKCHYRPYFMASLLDSNCKDKPKLVDYIMDCKKSGIRIFPPTLEHRNCYADYDENGGYIILGLNCISGVGNVEIPKDAPKDFKLFMDSYGSLNKRVIENLIKAGVFDGNRDEMIQYVTWFKDKRKSKPPFKYTETMYNKAEEEAKVIGMSFCDIFEDFEMKAVNNVTVFGYEVLEVKGRKTRNGKPMAFVKVRDNREVRDLVIFNQRYKELKAHKVYEMKLRASRIMDFHECQHK